MTETSGQVVAVHAAARHDFSKPAQDEIRLVRGRGVEGDAHFGVTVQHRSRVRRDPTQPNLRQVHLIHAELFDELVSAGFPVSPGDVGENVTTCDLDLLAMPRGTVLRLGSEAVVEISGLRNPCVQLDRFKPGLMKATLDRDAEGGPVRKAGVMGVVLHGGVVRPGDPIVVEPPPPPHAPLQPV